MKLTDATKAEIRKAAHNEGHLAQGVAEHTIWLLENQRAEWFAEPERTPEVVLRAMVNAYDAAAFNAMVAAFKAESEQCESDEEDGVYSADWRRFDALDEKLTELREETAYLVAGRDGLDIVNPVTRADYEARLSGERPLNAPPLEV